MSARTWTRTLQAIEEVLACELPRGEFERAATEALPARLFVWRDEWERAYNQSPDGPASLEKIAETEEDRYQLTECRLDFSPTTIPAQSEHLIAEFAKNLLHDELVSKAGNAARPTHSTDHQAVPELQSSASTKQFDRKRRDLLSPLIGAAQRECHDQNDSQAAFSVMRRWAQEKPPRPPLVGLTCDGRIQWRDSNDKPKELTAKALGQRLRVAR